jgi:hypothetical protein
VKSATGSGAARSPTALLAVVVAALALSVVGAPPAAIASSTVTVEDLSVDVDRGVVGTLGGRVDVETRFRVVNAGAAPVTPVVRIRVESQIGGGVRSTPTSLGPVAPGDQVRVTRTINSVLPFGRVRVVVSVRADGRTTTATASKAVIPWLLVVAMLVAVAGGLALRARRRHRRPAPIAS